jgi:hypothetical protein
MSTDLICPDCGGVIGGDPSGDRPACQCGLDLTMDDTEVEAQPAPLPADVMAPATAPATKKICCNCGKDVTNARRARDARGYWCWDCHRDDLRKTRGLDKPRARCPQCGRMVPAESITSYHGMTLCAKCRIEQDELPNHQKLKYKNRLPVPEDAGREKKRIIVLGAVVFVLLVIILLGKLHVI